jgi:hypothetical protein
VIPIRTSQLLVIYKIIEFPVNGVNRSGAVGVFFESIAAECSDENILGVGKMPLSVRCGRVCVQKQIAGAGGVGTCTKLVSREVHDPEVAGCVGRHG